MKKTKDDPDLFCIKVLHTSGSNQEIGYQHGEQMKRSLHEGMACFYHDFWKRLTTPGPSQEVKKWGTRGAVAALQKLVVRPMMERVPEWAQQRLLALAKVSQRSEQEFLLSFVLPDLFPVMGNFAARWLPSRFTEVNLPQFGCSSFISRGNEFLHGRNLDFPGVGYWDKFPLIQMIALPKGLKYVAFTSGGVPFGGITGVNEAQVSVSLHQHFCKTVSLKGDLPYVVGEKILNQATTLEQAVTILKQSKMNAGWAFILTDGKSREGAIFEYHPKASFLRPFRTTDSLMCHSNFFQSKTCQLEEYAATARMNWDMKARKDQLEVCVEHYANELHMEAAVKCLGDHFDPYWGEEKIINRTVSQAFNIQSLVLDTEKMKVAMARGPTPIHLGDYEEFDLGEIFGGKEGRTGTVYTGYRFSQEKMGECKRLYLQGFKEAFDGHEAQATPLLEQAFELCPQPEIALNLAACYLKVGDAPQALPLLEQSKEWIESHCQERGGKKLPPEYFEIMLYLARTCDLVGQSTRALELRQSAAKHPDLEDRNLQRILKKEKSFSPAQAYRMAIPFSTYVPFQ